VGIIVTVGAFAYLTKPTDSSFGTKIAQQAPLGLQTVGAVALNKMVHIDDYVFIKIANLSNDHFFLGVANQWISLKQ